MSFIPMQNSCGCTYTVVHLKEHWLKINLFTHVFISMEISLVVVFLVAVPVYLSQRDEEGLPQIDDAVVVP